MKKVIHFSGLNGLRAIAAVAVVFSHTTQGLAAFGLDPFILGRYPDGNPRTTLLAGFGVSIFFALSGFLITYLLLAERETGTINVRNFYIRRVLRIWPLYYLYLGLSVITLIAFHVHFEKQSMLFYVFLMANMPFIFGGLMPLVGHYWSLGVEEQFYAFWPWIVKKSRSVLKITIIITTSLILLKTAFKLLDMRYGISWPYNFLHVTRFHCMTIGAIGAICYFQKDRLFMRLSNHFMMQTFAWLIILLVALNRFHIISFLDNEIIAVITVILIIGQIEKTNRIVNLDLPLFDFLGKISYGIYVIHPIVIFYAAKSITFSGSANVLHYLFVYMLISGMTIAFAWLSYTFFEKRFMRWKVRFSTIHSSATRVVDP